MFRELEFWEKGWRGGGYGTNNEYDFGLRVELKRVGEER